MPVVYVAGFRAGMSATDVIQVMLRMEEDVVDCKIRINDENYHEWPDSILLKLKNLTPE